jgi:glycosyltransferase involved in cell wall biosynthesis
MSNAASALNARACGSPPTLSFPIMQASVIVTTYNRPDALRAVLAGLLAQQTQSFEILVADDGSRDDTRQTVAAVAHASAAPIRHVWQEDRGFRAGAARNRAAAQARGDYLLFLDGDCIPRPDWLSRHLRLAERGWMVAGNRVLLGEAFTRDALARQLPLHVWSLAQWRRERARGAVNRTLPLRRIPLGPLRKLAAGRWQRIRTCNLGLWRNDFDAVNGFDEAFEGWGFEDSDLAVRLLNRGVRRKEGGFATAVLHLWHRENDRRFEGENWDRLQQRIASRAVRATVGLDRYPETEQSAASDRPQAAAMHVAG